MNSDSLYPHLSELSVTISCPTALAGAEVLLELCLCGYWHQQKDRNTPRLTEDVDLLWRIFISNHTSEEYLTNPHIHLQN